MFPRIGRALDQSNVTSPFLGSAFEHTHVLTTAIVHDTQSNIAAHDLGWCDEKNVKVLLINEESTMRAKDYLRAMGQTGGSAHFGLRGFRGLLRRFRCARRLANLTNFSKGSSLAGVRGVLTSGSGWKTCCERRDAMNNESVNVVRSIVEVNVEANLAGPKRVKTVLVDHAIGVCRAVRAAMWRGRGR